MRVLITGGDGMLGSSICREALAQGYEVRVMVLPGRVVSVLEGLDVSYCYGNLLEPESLHQAVEGCDYVINVAASTQIWPRRSEIIWKVNYDSVEHLVEACKRFKVKRFVQIGTANSFGHGSASEPGNEQTPFNGVAYQMDYVDSKYKAQCYLIDQCKAGQISAVVINPTFMIGPFDSGPSSGKMLMALFKGSLPGYTSGMKNFVASKDVAVAAVNALIMGTSGSCYIAGNENLSFEQFFKKACAVRGIPFTLKQIPNFLIYSVGFFSSIFARVTGKAPKLGYHMAKQATMEQCYSPQKARDELNMPATPVEEAISDCIAWWKQNNYLS